MHCIAEGSVLKRSGNPHSQSWASLMQSPKGRKNDQRTNRCIILQDTEGKNYQNREYKPRKLENLEIAPRFNALSGQMGVKFDTHFGLIWTNASCIYKYAEANKTDMRA